MCRNSGGCGNGRGPGASCTGSRPAEAPCRASGPASGSASTLRWTATWPTMNRTAVVVSSAIVKMRVHRLTARVQYATFIDVDEAIA